MSDGDLEVHDHSRVDAFMAARRRAMMLHAVWRPMLAGAAGAALVIGCVWVTLPKFGVREVIVDRVTFAPKDVEVPRVTVKDLAVNNLVPREVEVDIPRIVAQTPAERAFTARPEYESAQFKGRLIADPDGLIRFDSGAVFVPVKPDPSGHMTQDFGSEYVTAPYIGDWAFCNAIPGSENLFKCLAIDHDVVVDLATTRRPKGTRS